MTEQRRQQCLEIISDRVQDRVEDLIQDSGHFDDIIGERLDDKEPWVKMTWEEFDEITAEIGFNLRLFLR